MLGVLAEELQVLDVDSHLWHPIRPLLHAAMRLEQEDEREVWHGWNKQQIVTFLQQLPSSCTLVAGVWDTISLEIPDTEELSEAGTEDREQLVFGCICEVMSGKIHTIRTFEALAHADLPPMSELEPGYQHALEIMHAVRLQVAPVAWALFTDQATWNEWLFRTSESGGVIDKGELLAALARQGRCVLMGSQTTHHHL